MTPNVWWVIGGAAAVGGVYLVYRSQAGEAQQPQQQSQGAASPLMMYAVPPSPTTTVAPDTGGILSVGSSIGATTGGPEADMGENGGMDSYYASQTSIAQMQYDLSSQQSQYDYMLGSESIQAQKQMTYAGLVAGFLDQLYPAGYSGSTQFGASPDGEGFKIDVTSSPSAGTLKAADSYTRAAANNYGYQSSSHGTETVGGVPYADTYSSPYTADQWASMSASQRYSAKHSLSQAQLSNVQALMSPEQAAAVTSQNKAAGLATGGYVVTNQYAGSTSPSKTRAGP